MIIGIGIYLFIWIIKPWQYHKLLPSPLKLGVEVEKINRRNLELGVSQEDRDSVIQIVILGGLQISERNGELS